MTALDGEFVQQDLVLRPHRSNVHAVLVRQERVDCFLLLLLGRFLLGVRGGEGACINANKEELDKHRRKQVKLTTATPSTRWALP